MIRRLAGLDTGSMVFSRFIEGRTRDAFHLSPSVSTSFRAAAATHTPITTFAVQSTSEHASIKKPGTKPGKVKENRPGLLGRAGTGVRAVRRGGCVGSCRRRG